MIKPYFYIIKFETLDLFYAGMRYRNSLPASEDLLIEYFTSSNKVKDLIKEDQKPSVFQVLEFDDVNKLADYESAFIKKIIGSPGWLNENSRRCVIVTEEVAKKISIANKGRKVDPEVVEKVRQSNTGKTRSPEFSERMKGHTWGFKKGEAPWNKGVTGATHSDSTKQRISETMKGKEFTEDHRKKLSDARKNVADVECPVCGKSGYPGSMKRWHFDNCRGRLKTVGEMLRTEK